MKKKLALFLLGLGSLATVSLNAANYASPQSEEPSQYEQPCTPAPCYTDTVCNQVPCIPVTCTPDTVCNPAPCAPAPCSPGC